MAGGMALLASFRRPFLSASANAVSSVGNLLLAVSIARNSTAEGFGIFSLAFSIYVITVGLCRASFTEDSLATHDASTARSAGSSAVVLVSLLCGAIAAALGFAFNLPYVIVAGIAMPGLAIYEHLRVFTANMGRAVFAVAQDAVWTATVAIAFLASLVTSVQPLVIFSVWAISGALIGILQAVHVGMKLFPSWSLCRGTARTAVAFGAQYLVGSGAAQLVIALMAVVSNASVVGGVRAAGTALAPCTLLLSSARGLIMTRLSRLQSEKNVNVRAIKYSILLPASVASLAVPIALIPSSLGFAVLGDSWLEASKAIPFIGGELIFSALTIVAFALHRVKGAGRRCLTIEAFMVPVRIAIVLTGAFYFGTRGAAAGMMAISGLGAALWWKSYFSIRRRRELGVTTRKARVVTTV
ncbi:hypothetical protein [Mangrovihabitans endophyticus]|uniref:hypothetical protein n=1 Tax=Mangrovihabitans endophyticus TaxID=1751298 RepID=UPI00166AC046|nr:hypothetical protein [Mangrovihabitans endophyticus]